MPLNSLYALLNDKKLDLSPFAVKIFQKKTTKKEDYLFIPMFKAGKFQALPSMNIQPIDFNHEGSIYTLHESHLSVYKTQQLKEEKFPVFSCYHYTLLYKSAKHESISIHVYFSRYGRILSVSENCFLIAKKNAEIIDLDAKAHDAILELVHSSSNDLLNKIHSCWNAFLLVLKDKINSLQLAVDTSSASVMNFANHPLEKDTLSQMKSIKGHIVAIESMKGTYEDYISYCFDAKLESQILKILKSALSFYEKRHHALNAIHRSQLAKPKQMNHAQPSPSPMPEKAIKKAPPTKDPREKELNALLQKKSLTAKESVDKYNLLEQKINQPSVAEEVQLFAIVDQLKTSLKEIQEHFFETAKKGDKDSFGIIAPFFYTLDFMHQMAFFFQIIKEGQANFLSHVIEHLSDFNPHLQDGRGLSLGIKACSHLDHETAYRLVEILINQTKLNVNSLVSLDGNTPLHIATENENIPLIKLLLQQGHNLNERQKTPTMIFAGSGNEKKEKIAEICNLLNSQSTYRTPLFYAAALRNEEIINLLLDNGADPCLRDYEGFNVLAVYVYKKRLEEKPPLNKGILARLSRLCDINEYQGIDTRGTTLVCYAAQEGDLEAVTLLLELGANPNLGDELQGITALLKAVYKGEVDIIRCIIEKSQFKLSEEHFIVALSLALNCGKIDMLPVLLSLKPEFISKVNEIAEPFFIDLYKRAGITPFPPIKHIDINSCSLLWLPNMPNTKEIEALNRSCYFVVGEQLFYHDMVINAQQKIEINAEKLKELEKLSPFKKPMITLSSNELSTITSITKHKHIHYLCLPHGVCVQATMLGEQVRGILEVFLEEEKAKAKKSGPLRVVSSTTEILETDLKKRGRNRFFSERGSFQDNQDNSYSETLKYK